MLDDIEVRAVERGALLRVWPIHIACEVSLLPYSPSCRMRRNSSRLSNSSMGAALGYQCTLPSLPVYLEKSLRSKHHCCDAVQVPLPIVPQMLRVRSLRRLAGDSGSLPALESLPIAQAQSSKPRIPIAPLALLFLCGLVAARVFPESSIISGEAGLGPGIVLPQLQQPEVSLPASSVSPSPADLTGVGLRCQSWCLTRDIYVTRTEVAHCQRQCTAHPEIVEWIPALKASAAAPAGINDRQLIFAAWYAEGERGSEVGFTKVLSCCFSVSSLAFPCIALLSYRQQSIWHLMPCILVHLSCHACASVLYCFKTCIAHRYRVCLGSRVQPDAATRSFPLVSFQHLHLSCSASAQPSSCLLASRRCGPGSCWPQWELFRTYKWSLTALFRLQSGDRKDLLEPETALQMWLVGYIWIC